MIRRQVFRFLLFIFILSFCISPNSVFAESDLERNYIIYTEDGYYLTERPNVQIGDFYISKDFKKYEIVYVDDEICHATARFLYNVNKPKVDINILPTPIATTDKVICLYMTHNDESYVPTDGTESVYGAGGIHDVANYFANTLRNRGIETYIDETLHIPHDSYAYSRSKVTANNLIKSHEPNAIFDIHRDGTSRAYYIKNVDGKEQCMIRIVIGKANGSMEINVQFSVYLMAVAEKIAPNLFKDIYYASGHYNQGLHAKSLLFEMGSHMVEKELVMQSVDDLAKVVDTALFATTVNSETGNLTINNNQTSEEVIIDKVLDDMYEENTQNSYGYVLIITLLSLGTVLVVALLSSLLKKKKTK